tara:strand:+ start:2689 stop:3231 length:543 start_codon:yes stop_codon:yes gene_type:complete
MKKVCVFAGSSSGNNQNYKKLSRKLGSIIANNGCHLFYGGGNTGLMGEVADGCLEKNGKVTGVIPRFLCDMQADHKGLTDMIITDTMHERKTIMYEDTSIFFALPGGVGTLEELMEVLTWKQLDQIKSRVLIVNIDGYWDNLFRLFNDLVNNEFMKKFNLQNFSEVKSETEIENVIKDLI